MHFSKAHTSSAPLGRERNYEAFTLKFAYILLAAIANGSVWYLISLAICSFFEATAGLTVPVAVGLMSGAASLIVLLALSASQR